MNFSLFLSRSLANLLINAGIAVAGLIMFISVVSLLIIDESVLFGYKYSI